VREYFLPMDIDCILEIPICTRRQEDFWAWNFDCKGLFLVRSAYRMIVSIKLSTENYYEGNAVLLILKRKPRAGRCFGKRMFLPRFEYFFFKNMRERRMSSFIKVERSDNLQERLNHNRSILEPTHPPES
jgi:hypothetical protein